VSPPHESYSRLFLRFLRFGFLAWGGPVAQIAMIKQELVEEERWVSREQFNRVLAVYQVLPGPEAHELCVYFGMLARGRIGAVLAGLGFMLPGFVLMLLLSWMYVRFGLVSPLIAAIFFGFKPAVAALIVRAVQRIGQHALKDRWLWGIAIVAGIATLLQLHFLIALALTRLVYSLIKRGESELPVAQPCSCRSS
jgi:chromate transporter